MSVRKIINDMWDSPPVMCKYGIIMPDNNLTPIMVIDDQKQTNNSSINDKPNVVEVSYRKEIDK